MYVEMKHIEKNYGSFHASRDVSFGVDKGKLVALLGPQRQRQDDDSAHAGGP